MNIQNKIYCAAICILLICIAFVGCDPRYGFLESKFQLSDNERLPKWFAIPQGYSRSDLKVTIDFYTSPFPFCNNAVITLYGPRPENKVIIKKAGKEREHPYTTKQFKERNSHDMCSTYLIITVDGIEEVFEQKCKGEGNLLYIADTDNPKLRESLKEGK